MAPRVRRRERSGVMKPVPRPGVAPGIRTAFLAALGAAPLLAAVGCGLAGSGNVAPTQESSPRQESVPTQQSLQQQFVRIVRRVSPSVVQINSPAGFGSGVLYDR